MWRGEVWLVRGVAGSLVMQVPNQTQPDQQTSVNIKPHRGQLTSKLPLCIHITQLNTYMYSPASQHPVNKSHSQSHHSHNSKLHIPARQIQPASYHKNRDLLSYRSNYTHVLTTQAPSPFPSIAFSRAPQNVQKKQEKTKKKAEVVVS
jgi:hypothetical protein